MLAEDVGDALQEVSATQVHQFAVTGMEGEGYLGVDKDDTLEGREDVIQLRGIRLEELTPDGDIIKEVLYLEVAAYGTGYGLLVHNLRGGNDKTGAHLVVGHAGEQFHLCHSGNGRQGLTAETHGMKGKEVVGLADLRCGMALKGQTGVGL